MHRKLRGLPLGIAFAVTCSFSFQLYAEEEPLVPREEHEVEGTAPAPPPALAEEQVLPDLLPEEQIDPVILLGELRETVRTSPERVDDRLKLAQVLYQLGDVDAALDECRAALALTPQSAKGHVQLGVILMAKQDWRSAAAAMKEAVQLDPDLAQAHYSLGTVQYSLGNSKAAAEAYRRALDLQPRFPDARYRLALVLQLTKQHQDAAHLMEEAAQAGVAQAQFFIGNAYRQGQGVTKDLERAVYWWARAAELGQHKAAEALSHLRRQALAADQTDRRRAQAREAFQRYRDELWTHYPDAVRTQPDEPLGSALLKINHGVHGVLMLLAETYALSEPAHDQLVRLYESGLDSHLSPFDSRILKCLETTSADGFIPAKKALARIYGLGLGVPQDVKKAKAALKGLPKQDVKPILDEISAQ